MRLKCDLRPNKNYRIKKGKRNQKNLAGSISNDQIQLNSIKFNGYQSISMNINGYQRILTDIDRFQSILTNITGDQQRDDWIV